jgi:ribonucleoside-diphosphate reductase alpha chain
MIDDAWFTDDFSKSIWETKYKGSSISIWNYFNRLASLVACGNDRLKNEFLHLMWSKKFSPGGRILAWAGRPDASLSLMNCTTHAIGDDSLESISDTVYTIMRASSRGQGIGIDISALRPAGSPVNNAARTSTGSISFMEMLNAVGGTIGQEGRRAALLFSIGVDHPDLLRRYDSSLPGGLSYDFMNLKSIPGRVENANISVRISDQFMKAVINGDTWRMSYRGRTGGEKFEVYDEISARELFSKLAESAHRAAEPGVLFWDTSRAMSNSDLFGFPIVGVNACLAPDTIISTEIGDLTISELSEMSIPPRVYTYNNETGEVVLETPSWVGKTREDANVITLVLEDGNELTLTPDHRVFTENRGWVMAGQLTVDDVLLEIEVEE